MFFCGKISCFKGVVYQKLKMSSFIQPHVIPNLYDLNSLQNIKENILKNVGNQWPQFLFTSIMWIENKMEVNGN